MQHQLLLNPKSLIDISSFSVEALQNAHPYDMRSMLEDPSLHEYPFISQTSVYSCFFCSYVVSFLASLSLISFLDLYQLSNPNFFCLSLALTAKTTSSREMVCSPPQIMASLKCLQLLGSKGTLLFSVANCVAKCLFRDGFIICR